MAVIIHCVPETHSVAVTAHSATILSVLTSPKCSEVVTDFSN